MRLPLSLLIACAASGAAVDFIPADGPGGVRVQIAVLPKRDCKANLVGLQLYELAPGGELGATALYRAQYYRTDERTIARDEDDFRPKGFPSKDTIEIEDRQESRHWLVDRIAGKQFDEAVRRLAENPESRELALEIHKAFRSAPFPLSGPPDRKSVDTARWVVGREKCGDVQFTLAPSPDYGNCFGTSVAAVATLSASDRSTRAR